MTVTVTFFKPRGIGPSVNAPGFGEIRAREAVTIPGTTTNSVQAGESVLVYNGETGAVLVAHGTTPAATTATATDASSAGAPVPAGQNSTPFTPATGAQLHIAAVP